jgi:cytochrome P450
MDDFDIHDPAFAACPFAINRELRERDPVHASKRYGGFHLLTRYADVRAAALDWRRFTSSVVGVTAIPVITPRTEPQLPIEIDPPLHSTYRALVNPTFAPARIAELRPRQTIETIAAREGKAARASLSQRFILRVEEVSAPKVRRVGCQCRRGSAF